MNTVDNELKKMMLHATLLANLTLLKEKMPRVYDAFKDYKPTNTGVAIDSNGNENLYNNGKFAYTESPREFAKKQVDKFLKNPIYSHYNIKHAVDVGIVFKHSALLKSINNVRNEETDSKVGRPTNENRLEFVCFLGGGLGYQIEELLNKKAVRNVFLFEPNFNSFYALLHCIELRPLFNKCLSQGGVFTIRVGGDEHTISNEISKLLMEQGHFNMSLIHFFQHYDSPLMTKSMDKMKEVAHRWHGGWGFFEDEIIGISHTLSNLKARFPVLKKTSLFKNPLKNIPVFIVANGPSLDSAIEFLLENKDNIIIVSCGTALKALLVNDIKPDMHIEMERTAGLSKHIEAIENAANITVKLNELNIIALNTVYDGILKRFKTANLLTKINDGGGFLIQRLDKKQMYSYPVGTNPTVTNTALAVVTELGFDKVYLVGADFGFISNEHHHSKHSAYYDSDYKDKEVMIENMQTDKCVKGNFTDTVFTNNLFDLSKSNIEVLLRHHPHVKAFNTSNGAYIYGAQPKRIVDVRIKNKLINKSAKITSLLQNATSLTLLSEKRMDTCIVEIQNKTKAFLEQLITVTSPYFTTREELVDAFALQHKMLLNMRDEDDVIYILVQGTFKYFQTYIMANTYFYDNLDKRIEFMNACIDAFHEHLNDIYQEFIFSYNKPAKV
ncbi:motility associated factor glycosyltransferase family protein [Pseudoalteromonas sp. SWXJZ10B]|uniref:motility associated factor glycosyltransferase family protein n=1 Tax=Pseudoalteromonas sp. SWXJZ10B TaxID=2792063 RepID=UPI001E2D1B21|nr:6-hydroxymethylpterin diphosphokinase MptE-like protein [Pseudoalteromonas sp. SWXJZ10B]